MAELNEGVAMHLTDQLQAELEKIGSGVSLQRKDDSIIKVNYKDWAFADINNRQFQASTMTGKDGKHVQLEERGIIACVSSTIEIFEMALIADKWLEKRMDVWKLAKEHSSIKVSERYQRLLTLSNDELLAHQWEYLLNRIEIGEIRFKRDVFGAFRKSFSHLYPFFSHDNLWFSNFIELPSPTSKSPIIFCNRDMIEIGLTLGSSSENFKTQDVEAAIKKTKELMPIDMDVTINPAKG